MSASGIVPGQTRRGSPMAIQRPRQGWPNQATVFIFILFFVATSSTSVDVRLSEGDRWYEGYVERNVSGVWQRVCADELSDNDIPVLCRHLGFPPENSTHEVRPVVNASVALSAWPFNCTGSERFLSQCPASSSSQCSQNQALFLSCQANLRLVGGTEQHEGRLEVYKNEAWYSVCGYYDFARKEANVVCKQLGYIWSEAYNENSYWYSGDTSSRYMYRYNCDGDESNLFDCSDGNLRSCSYAAGFICKTGLAVQSRVRLVNGTSNTEGRLQIFTSGIWATVCGREWRDANSDVICHSLFGDTFSGAIVPKEEHATLYGVQESGAILEDMSCSGSESDIFQCSGGTTFSRDWGCTHDWDVAIKCSLPDHELGVRLVNESVDGRGVLQLQASGQWSDVCAEDWDQQDATVVCRQLGHPPAGAQTYFVASHFTEKLARSFRCNGNETSLRECPSTVLQRVCQNTSTVHVACQATVRLTDGPVEHIGRLEIYERGSWHAVCRNDYSSCDYNYDDIMKAKVACRQLGYSSDGAVRHPARLYPQGPRSMYSYRLECTGQESSLAKCPKTYHPSACSSSLEMALSCKPENATTEPTPATRLRGGNTSYEGRLEVFSNGVWSTVCNTDWTSINSDVVCRSIFGSQFTGILLYGQDVPLQDEQNKPVQLFDNVWCDENAANLSRCSRLNCGGEVSFYRCNHAQDVALRCSEVQVRLVNGSLDGSGLLQQLSGGRWSDVCSDSWTNNSTTVACRELGYPTEGSYFTSQTVSSGRTGSAAFDCVGDEDALSTCSKSSVVQCAEGHVVLHCKPRVRLVGGQELNVGRLEIYRGGNWFTTGRTISPTFVCRTLGFGTNGRLFYPYYSNYLKYTGSEPTSEVFVYSCNWDDIHLSQCTMTFNEQGFYYGNILGVSCDNGTIPSKRIRLVNGTTAYDGLLQVFLSGSWSTVCDYFWSQATLDVACRSIFGQSFNGTMVLPDQRSRLYGSQQRTPILLRDIECRSGNEASLLDCSLPSGPYSCDHSSDIALMCNASSVRLVNGSVLGSGLLQYHSGGQWSYVCADTWGPEAARVVCRELGHPTTDIKDLSDDYTTIQPQTTVNLSFSCSGTEMSLSSCRTSPLNQCSRSKLVAIGCSATVRLTDGLGRNQGRLEIYDTTGTWYRMSSYNFRTGAASVVCKQLGYQETGSQWYPRSETGAMTPQKFPYLLRSDCSSQLTDLWKCRWFRSFSSGEVAVSCDTGETMKPAARLLDGANRTEGVLHVFSNGVWGTVCGTTWTDDNSRIACREMFGAGFTGARVPLRHVLSYKTLILLGSVRCTGNEETLLACSKQLAPPNCDHSEDIALRCFARVEQCGEVLQGESGTVSSPGFPAPYISAEDCTWIIDASQTGHRIRIAFSFVNISETQCRTNHIEVVDTEKATVLASYCGTGIPEPLTSEGSTLMIRLVSTYDAFGNSFNASWTTVCFEHLTEESGIVQSPRYPQKYPENRDCTFLIERPPGQTVSLTFQDFNLDGSDCMSNYVEIRDGPSAYAPLISRLCGDQLPPVAKSTQHSMWIKFHTEGATSAQSTGFHAQYTAVVPGCSESTLTDSSGTITSPGYPYPYPNHTHCVWNLSGQSGTRIKLTFSSVKTYGLGRDCFGHYVSVYDVDLSGKTKLIDTLCGTLTANDMQPLVSTNNKMKIVFQSSLYYPFYWDRYQLNGFKAAYEVYSPNDFQYPLFSLENSLQQNNITLQNDGTYRLPDHETGIPVGNERQQSVFASSNGFLTFGTNYMWPELGADKMMVCAYASYIDLTSGGGVSYGIHTELNGDEGVLRQASREVQEYTNTLSFTARLVLIVSWTGVKQRAFDQQAKDGEVTFETVIVTDERESYALIKHQVGGMHWQPTSGWPYVTIGVSDGKVKQEPLYSKNAYAYTVDNTVGNTGRRGSWIYKLGEAEPSPNSKCATWFARNRNQGSEMTTVFASLPRCPCSRRDVWRRARFTWTLHRSDNGGKVHCYRLTKTASRQYYPYSKECCYGSDGANSENFDQLILDPPFAGSALAFNPAYGALREGHLRDDRQAHDVCCVQSADKYCQLFYQLRPVGECQADIPFRFAWMFGDPHITTLDGTQYTFNGWGEYTMVSIATQNFNFTLQARTCLAETERGTLTNATVFTAFGAEENGARVFVQLDPNTKDSLIVFGGETDHTMDFRQNENFQVEEDSFTLMRDNHSLVTAFASGISFTVNIGMKSLDISIAMPLSYRNQTRGLLGNYNGVQGDDFVLPNGTVLHGDLTERQIFEQFGVHWAVSESVMRYGPRQGPRDYSHPEFTPLYLDEQPSETQSEAQEICGDNLACLYDYVATRSRAFASDSRQTKEKAEQEENQSKNKIPKVAAPANISAMAGQPQTIHVAGIDDDDDQLTYKLTNDGDGRYRIDPKNGTINATFDASNPTSVGVYAVDSQGAQSPVAVVGVVLCSGCSGHGVCDYDKGVPDDGDPNVQRALCVCDPAYTGGDCESELDACEDSPCLPHQTCTDFSASEQERTGVAYNCSGCPDGFELQDAICVDVDECSQPDLNACSQLCNNTGGSYACQCHAGYRLGSDGRTCRDVNECFEKTAGCNQTCNNTEGSFRCHCFDGYSLDGDGKGCSLNTVSPVCEDAACSQGCRPVANPPSTTAVAQCFCFAGYELDEDGTSCSDVDECRQGICSQTCLNSVGGFACSCRKGYTLDRDNRTCTQCTGLRYGQDCSLSCESCGGRAKECDHVTGCVCEEGWKGRQCDEDVDECSENPDVCGEGQVCSNTNGSYSCDCQPGFVKNASNVCVDVDECAEGSVLNQCGDLEHCSNTPGGYFCTCTMGYRRYNGTCTDVDECKTGGANCEQKCVNVPGSYNCDCNYGYRLKPDRASCVKVKDVCAEVEGLNCSQGCTIGDDDRAVCFCNAGFTLDNNGQHCSDVDECTSGLANCTHSCNNTGGGFLCSCPVGMKLDNDLQTCLDCPLGTWGEGCSKTCRCGLGSARCDVIQGCVCHAGWQGGLCDRDVNECDNGTVLWECQQKSAECFNFLGGHRCRCRQGFAVDDQGMCRDVDECSTSTPCAQKCENSDGSYRCQCFSGFSLSADGHTCNDVDECASTARNNCTQLCDNTPGSYRCSCDVAGYTLADDGKTCVAPAACSNTNCDTRNGGCVSENGAESCFCNNGYSLESDNRTCKRISIDWCDEEVCQQQCTETDFGASYSCSCHDGFLLNDDMQSCRECPEGTYGASCSQNCTCNTRHTAKCNTTSGECVCDSGWQGAQCTVDVNECQTTPGSNPACPDHSVCSNTNGSFLCFCSDGFTKVDESCEDIDECREDTDFCEQSCVNDEGSFNCDCYPGYTLLPGSSTCQACPKGKFGYNCTHSCTCDAQHTARCNATTGECVCHPEWQGVTCSDDVNECDTPSGQGDVCPGLFVCNNTIGSYTCLCPSGFVEEDDDCADVDECTENRHDCQQRCVNDEGSFHCECDAGYALLPDGSSCQDIDECQNDQGGCERACVNTAGSFRCDCGAGFVLNSADNKTCLGVASFKFNLTIDVDIEVDFANKESEAYQKIEIEVKQTLIVKFRATVTGFVGVNILSLRQGSLIAETETLVDQDKKPEAASDMAVSLASLSGQTFTIGDKTGQATLTVGGKTLSRTSSQCVIFQELGGCDQPDQSCDDSSGKPVCRKTEESKSEMWKIVVGVCVGVPLLVIIAGLIACCVLHSKKSHKKETEMAQPSGINKQNLDRKSDPDGAMFWVPSVDSRPHAKSPLHPQFPRTSGVGKSDHAFYNGAYDYIEPEPNRRSSIPRPRISTASHQDRMDYR